MRRLVGLAVVAAAALAVAEIALLVVAVHYLGAAVTLLLVLATSVVGFWVVRRQGGAAWRRFRAAAADGRPAGREVTSRLLALLGGLLLVLPGFLTDLAVALLQVPPVRQVAVSGTQRLVERRLSPSVASEVFGPRRVRVRTGTPRRQDQPPGPSPVLEGEIVDPPQRPDPPA